MDLGAANIRFQFNLSLIPFLEVILIGRIPVFKMF